MAKASGYSVWVIPTGDAYDKLRAITSRLSKRYNTPEFDPHVTLIGGVLGSEKDVVSKTSRLASTIGRFTIQLGTVHYADDYFMPVYIKAAETSGLLMANMEAVKIFGMHTVAKYMPHMSLVYGDLSVETKNEIIRNIGNKTNIAFDAGSIHLFSTDGEPGEWYKVKAFPLK